MNDYFALLGEPRRPWIDCEALKSRFLQLSAPWHPDRFHRAPEPEKQAALQRFSALNAAAQCLAEPRDRLLHLLELERLAKPQNVQRIPPGTMDLFMQVGQRCRDVDAFLAERAKVTSPLLKVQMFQKSAEWTDILASVQQAVEARHEELTSELKAMNAAWEAAPPVGSPDRAGALPLERLENIYRVLSYVSRWTEQLQERLVQLAI